MQRDHNSSDEVRVRLLCTVCLCLRGEGGDSLVCVGRYQSACNYNARVPTDIPWPNVDLQCSVSEHGCSYLVTIPHTYSSGDNVNCSIRAVFGAATSAWSALPWKDVPPSEQGMVATPIIEPHDLYSFYGLPKPSPVPGVTQVGGTGEQR